MDQPAQLSDIPSCNVVVELHKLEDKENEVKHILYPKTMQVKELQEALKGILRWKTHHICDKSS